MNIKRYIYNTIQPNAKSNISGKIFDVFIMILIVLNIASVFIITFNVGDRITAILDRIEEISMVIFSFEYILRLWTADYLYPEAGKIKSRLQYITSGMAIVDLIAILPFCLPMFLPVNLVGVRAFKLLRLFSVFKINRYSDALSSIGVVVKKKFYEIMVSVVFVFILLVIVSLLIYYVEHDAQPDKFENAFSGLWWAVATLTTVGYGDIYPITILGKILGTLISIMGIGMVAIPTGILSSGFIEILSHKKTDKEKQATEEEEKKYCPHCGKKL